MAEQQTSVADLMDAFSHSAGSGDEEMLRIAQDYALQIRPDQIYCLMNLKMFALDYGSYNKTMKTTIELFIKDYLEMKHYHESGFFIRQIIADLSLKRIIPADATKINVMKGN